MKNLKFSKDLILPEGKITPKLLNELLLIVKSDNRNKNILIGPSVGEDGAIVTSPSKLVISTDPITLAGKNQGFYAVAINCNDIVAMGGEPLYFTTSILIPKGTLFSKVKELFENISSAAKKSDLTWIGGHTEVTDTVKKPVVVGTAIGELKGPIWSSSGACPGDYVLMTKWVAIEGSIILAQEHPQAQVILGETFNEVTNWIHNPGISLLQEGIILRQFQINSAHDPTEGGVAQGLHEIAVCSGIRIEVYKENLPIKPSTQILCSALNINPLGLLSSGVLIFTVPPSIAEKVIVELTKRAITGTVIGKVLTGSGVMIREKNSVNELPTFNADEITRI